MHTNHDYYSQHSSLDDHRPSLKRSKLINYLNHIILHHKLNIFDKLTNIFEICLLKTSATTNMSGCLSSPIKFTNLLLTFLISSCLFTVIRYFIGGSCVALTNVMSNKKKKKTY